MALYQLALVTFLSLGQAAGQTLADLEKRAAELNANKSWSVEIEDRKIQLNLDLTMLIDSNVLKTADDFRRARSVVVYRRADFLECRMRYELAVTAIALGDSESAKQIRVHWDEFIVGTGRLQRLGSLKDREERDKYAVNTTVASVQTVFDNPQKAKEDAVKLTPNTEIRNLVEEDQKVRQGDFTKFTVAQWLEMSKGDVLRRSKLKSLLKEIKLMTAQDYHDAALVMQHGSWFDDYALAHELSVCATILDPKIGRQMVALSYDRMLVSAGYLQRVATQYHGVTLTPVDSSGFSDNMRIALGRKPLAEVPKKLG